MHIYVKKEKNIEYFIIIGSALGKKTKFYAIKEGDVVNNLIVKTWNGCSKLVLEYNLVYIKVRKSKRKPITIRLDSNLEIEFENRCLELDKDKVKII